MIYPEIWFWVTLAVLGWALTILVSLLRLEVLKTLLDKTSIANIVAGIIVAGTLAYALLYKQDPPELVKTLAYMSAVYLFGRGLAYARR